MYLKLNLLNKTFFCLLLFTISLLQSCIGSKTVKEHKETNFFKKTDLLSFIQENNKIEINQETQEVFLLKSPFAIHFFTKPFDLKEDKFYPTLIVCSENRKIFDKLFAGTNIQDTPFFGLGTGIAAYPDGYDALYIDDEANHYLFYKDETLKRAKLIAKTADEIELEWNINFISKNNKNLTIKELNLEKLYLIVFNDKNSNGIADENEFNKIILNFK